MLSFNRNHYTKNANFSFGKCNHTSARFIFGLRSLKNTIQAFHHDHKSIKSTIATVSTSSKTALLLNALERKFIKNRLILTVSNFNIRQQKNWNSKISFKIWFEALLLILYLIFRSKLFSNFSFEYKMSQTKLQS